MNSINDKISKTLLVNKPLDWTSFDVVKKIRGLIKKKYDLKKIKVGHAGTLDPRASGLLIICTGSNTKQMQMFESLDKKYMATMKMGVVTDSFDSETEEYNKKPYQHLSKEDIHSTFSKFLGLQDQKPPIFSAIKVEGERLYKKARRGELNFKLQTRRIIIKHLNILDITPPFIQFEVECSKGTYIRSLVHDIGQKLLCGGYLYGLKRVAIGHYKLENSIEMDSIIQYI